MAGLPARREPGRGGSGVGGVWGRGGGRGGGGGGGVRWGAVGGRATARPPSPARAMPTTAVPPILTTLVGRLAEAVPRRARTTFTELLLGAATPRGGHVTDAILAARLSRSWTSYYWFLQRGRWAWLAVWRALLAALQELFAPPVWHVVIDDTLVERVSAGAPGPLIHHN